MKVLFFVHQWPNPNETAAGKRTIELIGFFKKYFNAQILLLGTVQNSNFCSELEMLNVRLVQLKVNTDEAQKMVQDFQPDVVIYDRFMMEEQFSWRVREVAPNALQILDSQDLHFLRKARQTAFKNQTCVEDELYSETAIRELASILRVDLTLLVSKVELDLLKEQFSISKDSLYYFPLLAEKKLDILPFGERKNFFFIGNGLHEPNIDAIFYLKNELWPIVRKALPETELHIVGAFLPEKVKQLHKPKEGFIVLGYEADLNILFNKYRLLLAPLRFGAGLKGKLLDACRFGIPSITTEIGVEGMCSDTTEWPGFVSENTDDLCNHAISFYQNEEKWNEAREKAKCLLTSNFLPSEHEAKLQSRLSELFSDLEGHRRKHFISSILNHNSLQSYKYMSKWIQLKNEK